MSGEWVEGTPPKGKSEYYLGQSQDGRLWLLKFIFHREVMCWSASGFHREGTHPEFRLLKEENRGFIISHRALQ